MGSIPAFVPHIGPDGLPADVPLIAYTEKILEEKEQKLKQYIQDNYSKIRNVEKELATLAFEVKLTAGPKKHALEHLRKMIETSTEKIKVAKLKEEQARKALEAAEKAVKAEEANKQRLCEDLNRLVQESAAASYTRLEDLTRRLEALNPNDPPPKETVTQESAGDSSSTTRAQQSAVPDAQQPASTGNEGGKHVVQRTQSKGANRIARSDSSTSSSVVSSSTSSSSNSSDSDMQETRSVGRTQNLTMGQHISMGRGLGRTTSGGRAKGALVLGAKSNEAAGWTGAGFNVHDDQQK